MPINFPDSPSINDEYSAEGRTWTWDGTAWLANETSVSIVSAASPITFIGNQIAIDQNALVIDGGTSAAPQSSINLRRSTAAQWVADSSILASGEPGFESDTNKLKLGDGVSTWTALSYSSGGGGVEISSTAPTDTEATPLWWDTDEGKLYIFYDNFWVQAVVGTVGPEGPAGEIGPAGPIGPDSIVPGPEGASGGITYTITNSGASAYNINGADNPTLSVIRGHRYILNVNASGHPFWIQTVSGAYSSGDVYSGGVTNGAAEAGTIIWEVPFDAPDNLYYACQYHSSMAGLIIVSDLGPTGVVAATHPVTYDAGTQTVGIDLSDYTPKTSTVSSKTAAYTLVLGDKASLITATGTFTITIPGATFSTGDKVDFMNIGTGTITFLGSGVTINSVDDALSIDTRWAAASLFFISSSSAVLVGKLA